MTLEEWNGGDHRKRSTLGHVLATEVRGPHQLALLVVPLLSQRPRRPIVVLAPNGSTGVHMLWTGLKQRSPSDPVREPSDQETSLAREMVRIFSLGREGIVPVSEAPLSDRWSSRSDVLRKGARDRVRELPMLSEAEAQRILTGTTGDKTALTTLIDAGLVIAVAANHSRDVPAFQFLGAELHPTVVHANLLLRGRSRPWGVARWWTTVDPVLQMTPVNALAHPRLRPTLLDRAEASGASAGTSIDRES